MSELEKAKDFLETFGAKPWTLSEGIGPAVDREIEPWMVDFVKKRHQPQEWDAFYAYYNSGPLKRAYCRFAGILFEIIGIL